MMLYVEFRLPEKWALLRKGDRDEVVGNCSLTFRDHGKMVSDARYIQELGLRI